MNKLERLDFMIRFLIFTKKISYDNPKKDLAIAMQITSETISRALSGKEKFLTDSLLRNLNNTFDKPVPEDWLIKGEGENYINYQHIGAISYSTTGDIIAGNKSEFYAACDSCKSEVEKAKIIIEYLEKIIADKEKIIELLTNK